MPNCYTAHPFIYIYGVKDKMTPLLQTLTLRPKIIPFSLAYMIAMSYLCTIINKTTKLKHYNHEYITGTIRKQIKKL